MPSLLAGGGGAITNVTVELLTAASSMTTEFLRLVGGEGGDDDGEFRCFLVSVLRYLRSMSRQPPKTLNDVRGMCAIALSFCSGPMQFAGDLKTTVQSSVR